MGLPPLYLVEVNMFKPNTHKGLYKDLTWIKNIKQSFEQVHVNCLSKLVSCKYIADENILLFKVILKKNCLKSETCITVSLYMPCWNSAIQCK